MDLLGSTKSESLELEKSFKEAIDACRNEINETKFAINSENPFLSQKWLGHHAGDGSLNELKRSRDENEPDIEVLYFISCLNIFPSK